MNVSLTPELEKFVNDKVQSGMYYSASEVIRESLRLLQERDELKQRRVEEVEEIQQRSQGVRPLGQDKGLFTVPEDFNAPLPDDMLWAFENGIS